MLNRQEVISIFAESEIELQWLKKLMAPLSSEYSHWLYHSNWQDYCEALDREVPTCCVLRFNNDDQALEAIEEVVARYPTSVLPMVCIQDAPVSIPPNELPIEWLQRSTLSVYRVIGAIAATIRVAQLQCRDLPGIGHDPLTGLINREMLLNRLTQSLSRCNRYGERCALICVNFNHFKSVNEKYGYRVGDELLQMVSERIETNCRNTDSVARFGGDEFVVLIENADKNIGRKVADKLYSELTRPYQMQGQLLNVTVAMGMANYPDTAKDAQELLNQAGQALSKAKADCELSFVCFSEQHKSQLHRRHVLERELAKAIENDHLKLVYQPIVSATDFDIRRIEVLSRWPREDFNVPAPELIEMIDRLNLTEAFHNWLFYTAFNQMHLWQVESMFPDLCINIPANYCYSTAISLGVIRELKNFNIEPHKVELEITESTLMRYPERSIKVLNQLHNEGIKIAVDDFGTGFSCMSYLTSLPIDTLKIDREFFLAQHHKMRNKKVIEAIVALGHSLELEVIAEGVETDVQLALAQSVGCDLLQGYYFGRPEFPGDSWAAYVAQFQHIANQYPHL